MVIHHIKRRRERYLLFEIGRVKALGASSQIYRLAVGGLSSYGSCDLLDLYYPTSVVGSSRTSSAIFRGQSWLMGAALPRLVVQLHTRLAIRDVRNK